jgi:hypothetical protein
MRGIGPDETAMPRAALTVSLEFAKCSWHRAIAFS